MKKIIGGALSGAALTLGLLQLTGVYSVFDASGAEPPTSAAAVTEAALGDHAAELDAMFAEAYAEDKPGVSVIVTKGDEVILRQGYGLADLEQSIAIEADTVFRLGSITKQFTAVAILLLEQDGLLKTSDDVREYLPDYPTHDEVISIEHLLTHTSGIPNYTDIPGFFENSTRNDMTVDEVLALTKDSDLDFKPGASWNYSNSGYVLLGAIIEKVSGKSYAEFVAERIFQPLGMTSSFYGSNFKLIPNRARGYQPHDDQFEHAPYISMTIPHAAGSLLSSVEDLYTWNTALLSGQILPPETLERAWTSGVLTSGDETGYGYGWGIGNHQGLKVVHHNGGIPGFVTSGISFPNEQIYVAVLSNNQSDRGIGLLTQRAASLIAGKPIASGGNGVSVSENVLSKYVGSYQAGSADLRVLTLEDGKLMSQRGEGAKYPLLFSSDTAFFFDGSSTAGFFEFDDSGSVTAMVVVPWAGKGQSAPKL